MWPRSIQLIVRFTTSGQSTATREARAQNQPVTLTKPTPCFAAEDGDRGVRLQLGERSPRAAGAHRRGRGEQAVDRVAVLVRRVADHDRRRGEALHAPDQRRHRPHGGRRVRVVGPARREQGDLWMELGRASESPAVPDRAAPVRRVQPLGRHAADLHERHDLPPVTPGHSQDRRHPHLGVRVADHGDRLRGTRRTEVADRARGLAATGGTSGGEGIEVVAQVGHRRGQRPRQVGVPLGRTDRLGNRRQRLPGVARGGRLADQRGRADRGGRFRDARRPGVQRRSRIGTATARITAAEAGQRSAPVCGRQLIFRIGFS